MVAETKKEIKLKSNISLIDESVEGGNFSDFHLALEVGVDGVTFAILDLKKNKYLLLESYLFRNTFNFDLVADELDSHMESWNYTQKNFSSVSCSIVTNVSTLIPSPLFEKGKEESYLKLNHITDLKSGEARADKLKNTDVYNVYFVQEKVKEVLKKKFPKVSLVHFATSLIDTAPVKIRAEKGKRVIVHVQLSHFEIVIAEGKQLLFYNSFNHQSTEDFLYYLLFTCEQQKLSPENLELILIGEVEKNSALYSILHKYVRNVKFGERPDNFQYSYRLDNIPKHFYYNLFNQYLCVS